MIDKRDLNRCMDILAKLHANTQSNGDKQLLLELGYIIKQELDLVNAWEESHNKQARGREQIDVSKLLEDNAQLYKENQTLIGNLDTMRKLIEDKIPSIEDNLHIIGNKFNVLHEQLERF